MPRSPNILQVLFELPRPILSQQTERVQQQSRPLGKPPTLCLPSLELPICLQRTLSSTSVFSYMMPSKPLAAKSSVFNLPKQRSSTATSFMMSRRQSLRNQTSPKTDYNDFFKMLGYFYGDIVGLEVASGLPAGGASAMEMSSSTLRRRRRHQPLLRQQPGRMVPALRNVLQNRNE